MRQGRLKEPIVRLDLRIPKSLHAELKKRAERETRSINGEIIQALKNHLNFLR